MDPRIFSVVLAAVVLVLATVNVLLYRKVERVEAGAHGLAARLLLYSLWTLSLIGIYSASSFIWAGDTEDWLLESLRYIRLGLTTAVGIMQVGVMVYWLRIIRRS